MRSQTDMVMLGDHELKVCMSELGQRAATRHWKQHPEGLPVSPGPLLECALLHVLWGRTSLSRGSLLAPLLTNPQILSRGSTAPPRSLHGPPRTKRCWWRAAPPHPPQEGEPHHRSPCPHFRGTSSQHQPSKQTPGP